ncbi:hypothetical protein AC482_02970 [miscellaneous Crenarchaeota group-15 archaeon DG-45]|uniref:Uncharacterized protein n=1 Tax=miscellaneous Crenarchaeota group-15 archaeon DG-45 TaxID=1685127 RepID=A0A0M0BQD4_9ARCH|nr:MAG: hypothetical protein AC482_02970 [miscellaneous Crenarchaeota group-15 archaeon DG-45]
MPRRRRRRRGSRGRMPTPVYIGERPVAEAFLPQPAAGGEPPIVLEPEELEALRLVDLEGLSQEEAGGRMGVSRGTVWRLLHQAREKVARALTEGRRLVISTGAESG